MSSSRRTGRTSRRRAVTIAAAVALAATIPAGRSQAASGCGDPGDTAPVNDGFPDRMSSLVGADVRTGAHECFERVVIELQGEGELPGYWVRYEADPVLDSPRGEPVDVAGAATLVVSLGVWMVGIDGSGYAGPREFVPDNVEHIAELELIEDFEGQSAWAIGLDAQRPFTVSTLTDPVRVVIDIATAPTGAPTPGDPGGGLPPTR